MKVTPPLNDMMRLQALQAAVEQLAAGIFDIQLPDSTDDDLMRLSQALRKLADELAIRQVENQRLERLTTRINAGLLLQDVLESVYQDFRAIIPYNRIGLALIEDGGQNVRSVWARTDLPNLKLRDGFTAPLVGSSLEAIIQTRQPRILNDLEDYLRRKPGSTSTRLIVEEGLRASLTCPLIANDLPIGFIFFSSIEVGVYSNAHVTTFQRIADQLSVVVERGRLTSELAAQKDAVEQKNTELQQLSEMRSFFVGVAAHDLRGPLGNIQLAAQLLREMLIPSNDLGAQKLAGDIHRQAMHLLQLIDDLLDISQIEAGKIRLALQPIEISIFVAEALAQYVAVAAAKQIQIAVGNAPSGQVLADPSRLHQALDNLLSNAIKYSPVGSTVRVWVEPTESGWKFSVQDEGPGIASEERDLLFQEFSRLSARPTGGEKSVGLGLAITKWMVEAQGGQIGVESEPGQGAIFWFTLPAAGQPG